MMITVGDFIGVFRPSACHIVHEVSRTIVDILFAETVVMSTNVSRGFYEVAAFSHIIGVIDGTCRNSLQVVNAPPASKRKLEYASQLGDKRNRARPLTCEEIGEAFLDSGSEVDFDEDIDYLAPEFFADNQDDTLMDEIEQEIFQDELEEEGGLSEEFLWSETFFTGRQEEFRSEAGPTIAEQSAYGIFTSFWDRPTMEYIVDQTNHYAWQNIAQSYEDGENIPPSSRMHSWHETNVDEMYVFFFVLMYMAVCYRAKLD